MSNSGKATLENSIKDDIDLELIGNSVQPTTTGKNLFGPKQLQGISGFTIEGNEITQSGYNVSTGKTLKQLCPEITPGTYILSANNGDFTGLFGITKPMYKKSAIEIVDEDLNGIVALVGNPNKTIKYTLQIEKGNTVTPYEPYTGLKPSPSPEYQQEIKSAGRKSKNLFDINYFKDKSNLQTIQGEGFTLLAITCNVKPNTKYTLSANLTEAKYNLNIANKTQRYSLTSSPARTLMSNDDGTLYIGLFNTTADTVNMDDFMQQYKNIQLEEGNTATYYEAYSDKYLLDVKVTGKNLFDREKARDTTNWIIRDGDGYAKFPIRVGKGNKVTFSYAEKLMAGKGFYIGIAQSETGAIVSWLYHSAETNLNNKKYTAVAAGDYIYLSCTISGIQKFVDTIQTLQVEIGSEQTEYEPYTEQVLTLTSDRPITKWDKLVEQGGEYGWLYQSEVKEYRGETTVSPYRSGFYFLLNNKNITKGEGYCSELKQDVPYEKNPCISFNMSQNTYAYTLNTQEIYGSTVSEIKEYLKIHPLHLVYKTETSDFIPLSQEEQTQLRNLHSYNGTTHITVDSGEVPCGIKVAYKQKK